MLSFREVKVSFTKEVILDLDLRDCYAGEGRWAKNVRMNVSKKGSLSKGIKILNGFICLRNDILFLV